MNGTEWLFSLVNFEKRPPAKYSGNRFRLDRYKKLLEDLGSPQQEAPPTLHLVGTDGKGSTLAFLETLFRLAGKTTCAFVSPHLVTVEERFRIDGRPVDSILFRTVLEEVRRSADESDPPTFFEALNAAFWLVVVRTRPDYVLLETGLGGRLDTTRISKPVLRILTRLERDHHRLLGKTMREIALEKLAALNPETPVLIAPQHECLERGIRDYLDENGIDGTWIEKTAEISIKDRSPDAWTVNVVNPGDFSGTYRLGLLGDHQTENFASALGALWKLGITFPRSGPEIEVFPRWPGRCQILSGLQGGRVILDGSHTACGGQALRRFIDRMTPEAVPRTYAFACTSDRNAWCYLRGLIRPGDRLILASASHPRLWNATELSVRLDQWGWNRSGLPRPEVFSPAECFSLSKRSSAAWVYCGSFYWVGEVLRALPDRSEGGGNRR